MQEETVELYSTCIQLKKDDFMVYLSCSLVLRDLVPKTSECDKASTDQGGRGQTSQAQEWVQKHQPRP